MTIGRFELLRLPDRALAVIYPVRRDRLAIFDALLRELQQRWLELQGDTAQLIASDWDLIVAIATLIPSDSALPLQIETLKQHPDSIEDLLLAQWDGEKLEPSIVLQLNSYESVSRKRERQKGDAVTIADLPFPTCGDSSIDGLANLSVAFDPTQALLLWQSLDAESIDKMLTVLNELRRDPDERIGEYIGTLFAKFKAENQEEYNRSMREDW